jgi:hypothetical protein
LGVGLTTLPCKKENVEKPPRNSAGFCGGGQSLSWAVEPRKEERICFEHLLEHIQNKHYMLFISIALRTIFHSVNIYEHVKIFFKTF